MKSQETKISIDIACNGVYFKVRMVTSKKNISIIPISTLDRRIVNLQFENNDITRFIYQITIRHIRKKYVYENYSNLIEAFSKPYNIKK